VRDIVEWSIPILWPIDLINLPRRGPRPTLKGETRLTLKVMDDLGVPENQNAQPQQDGSGLWRRPSAYDAPPQPEPQPQPISQAPPQPAPQVQQVQVQPVYLQPVQVQPVYVQAPQPVYYQQYVYVTPPPPPVRMYYGPQVVYRRPAPYWGAPPPY
jgi:hypothetical protein